MIERIALRLGLAPDAPHLLEALTHPSYANERSGARDNQRLEFLGDSVLGFCVSELLFERFPEAAEGTLTRLRAGLVNDEALAEWGRAQGLAPALRLGRGAAASGLSASTNVLADAVEALIAATFLDGGLDAARRAVRYVIEERLAAFDPGAANDAKSELQERVQARGLATPLYVVVASGGPAHDPWFEVEVRAEEQVLGRGRGRSKRQAERCAAQAALAAAAWQAPAPEADREVTHAEQGGR
ncbi:MAG TPA: ribonuclease III [Polyangiaceae bacterium]|nr:ribonuclease III [Polyangiaceae bacterium]